jgi:Bacterial regulatory proteins, lacI family
MTSRIAFHGGLAHAMRVRGLTLTEVARRAHVTLSTVSRAVSSLPVNLTTALRIARVVSACPVVLELEEWGMDPPERRYVRPKLRPKRAAAAGRGIGAASPPGRGGTTEQLRIDLG